MRKQPPKFNRKPPDDDLTAFQTTLHKLLNDMQVPTDLHNNDIQQAYQGITQAITESATRHLPAPKATPKRPWISQKTLDLIEGRNHAGKDLYKFDHSVVPKSGSFFMRQVHRRDHGLAQCTY